MAVFKIDQDNLPVYVRAPDIYRAEQGTTTKGLELELNGEFGALAYLMSRYDICKNLSATLNANNVFDRIYYTYADNWCVYGAPRNFMTSFKYPF